MPPAASATPEKNQQAATAGKRRARSPGRSSRNALRYMLDRLGIDAMAGAAGGGAAGLGLGGGGAGGGVGGMPVYLQQQQQFLHQLRMSAPAGEYARFSMLGMRACALREGSRGRGGG